MQVRVIYHAQIRVVMSRPNDELELPDGCTLFDALKLIAASSNESLNSHLFATLDTVRPSLMVIVNNALVPHHALAQTELRDGDVVALMPPIAGG